MTPEQRKLAHDLFDSRMGNMEVERMIRSKEFLYGMQVAKECIERHFKHLKNKEIDCE